MYKYYMNMFKIFLNYKLSILSLIFFIFCFFYLLPVFQTFSSFWVLVFFSLLFYIVILLKVASFTLVERKVMGSIQRRLGPNVIGLCGLLQPFADGLKLATKEMIIPTVSTPTLFYLAPIWSFFLSLVSWSLIPFHSDGALANPNIGLLILLMISSMSVYGLLLAGWSSNSKYALFGSIRSVAQMISYEVVFVFVLMPILFIAGSLNLTKIGICTTKILTDFPIFYMIGFFPLSVMFFIIIVAETNRAPFDLPEAEAELVAGFNVEYSSFIFALFFLGEYSSILVMSSLFVIFFLGGWSIFPFSLVLVGEFWFLEVLFFSLKLFFVCFLFIWVRATFPRLRFDYLMYLCWEVFLPLSFGLLFYHSIIGLK